MTELDKVIAKIGRQCDEICATINGINDNLRETRDALRDSVNQHGYCAECGGKQREGETFYNGACNSCVVRIAAESDPE